MRTLCTIAFLALVARGGEPLNRLVLETQRVIVFKDGYALVVKEGAATPDAKGEVFTEDVPDAAVLGCFWTNAVGGELLSVRAGSREETEETTEPVSCTHMLEVLKANEGKICTVELDDRTRLVGMIKAVLARYVPRHGMPFRGPSGPEPQPSTPLGLEGTLFVLGTETGDVVLSVNRVRRLDMKEVQVESTRLMKHKRTLKRLTFRVRGGEGRVGVRLIYFRPGLRWIPTYKIALPDESAEQRIARVSLQAEILNEAEDFAGVPFDLVAGVPNFRFKEIVSPLVLERTLHRALQQAAPDIMGQSSPLMAQHMSSRGGERVQDPFPEPDVEVARELAAGGKQDLFVYEAGALDLARGERAAVPLLTVDAPCVDVYTWDLSLNRHDIETAPQAVQAESPLKLSRNRIWHQLELRNDSKVPWTTGAALITSGHHPLAQELLTYTPPGGRVRVPLTVAVDLRGEFSEEETGRELKALEWSRTHYARIDKLGKLFVTNSKPRAVDLEIVCQLGGKAVEATPAAQIRIAPFEQGDWTRYRGDPAINNHSTVRWRSTVPAGKRLEGSVRYHYFTRH